MDDDGGDGTTDKDANTFGDRDAGADEGGAGGGTGGGAGDESAVVVYWRPWCPYCINLRSQLRLARFPHTQVNIWADPEAAAFVRSVADETVPTVTVGGRAMVNPSFRQIRAALRTHQQAERDRPQAPDGPR
jgi:glutaredoxin